ncbi:hypothetical protein LCGC14_0646500 [marine sediment metagenome]|uniref:Uncharacterized protein n=1 Tax=marine sediment metagenome TaxID=412755 RepID=A0A0F9QXN2_9ZZZZ
MSIKSKIEQLTIQERQQLAHAFDRGFSQFIETNNSTFVGVNLDHKRLRHLVIEEEVGVWSTGKIQKL